MELLKKYLEKKKASTPQPCFHGESVSVEELVQKIQNHKREKTEAAGLAPLLQMPGLPAQSVEDDEEALNFNSVFFPRWAGN